MKFFYFVCLLSILYLCVTAQERRVQGTTAGWIKYSHNPVLGGDLGTIFDISVMKDKIFKMWYSGGEQYEPDAIGYATSKDGLHWKKFKNNPIFANNQLNEWEQRKVTACQVIKRDHDYLMFYIGFKHIEYAQIGMARSKDGVSKWERYSGNPLIKPGSGWDATAVYKPYAVADEKNKRWLLYYNGRNEKLEQIGIAIHEGLDFGF
jgi:beta-1,2-mannobiose phosphorylase / 1,2-beta-oligomannan phosphorylase